MQRYPNGTEFDEDDCGCPCPSPDGDLEDAVQCDDEEGDGDDDEEPSCDEDGCDEDGTSGECEDPDLCYGTLKVIVDVDLDLIDEGPCPVEEEGPEIEPGGGDECGPGVEMPEVNVSVTEIENWATEECLQAVSPQEQAAESDEDDAIAATFTLLAGKYQVTAEADLDCGEGPEPVTAQTEVEISPGEDKEINLSLGCLDDQ